MEKRGNDCEFCKVTPEVLLLKHCIGLLFFPPILPKWWAVKTSRSHYSYKPLGKEAFTTILFFRKHLSISGLPSLFSPRDALDQLNWRLLKDTLVLAKSFRDHELLSILLWISLFKWLRSKEFENTRYLWDCPTSSISHVSSRMNQYRENLWPQTGI